MDELKKKIRQICTYHSELGEGTSGYDLSEEQFQKLFDLYAQSKIELISKASEIKNPFIKEVFPVQYLIAESMKNLIISSLEVDGVTHDFSVGTGSYSPDGKFMRYCNIHKKSEPYIETEDQKGQDEK